MMNTLEDTPRRAPASHRPSRALATLTLALALPWAACNGEETPDAGNPDGGGGDGRSWHVVQENLPGALLSIWGRSASEIWLAGAAKDAQGPLAMRGDGTNFTRLDTGISDHLWWVFGRNEEVWFTGANGTILLYDRNAQTFERIRYPSATGTTAVTLYGIWGPSSGPLYTVGGDVTGNDATRVVVKLTASTGTTSYVASVVTNLPSGIEPDEVMFKVWGTASNDVWVIGTKGSVLHYDGTDWGRQVLPGKPRLITLHGSGKDDVVVVGGMSQGAIFEKKSGPTWDDASPPGILPLNGIFVVAGGHAFASGVQGVTLERKDGFWNSLPFPDKRKDWHAAWIDENGDLYTAGGNLASADALDDGTLLRYGPTR